MKSCPKSSLSIGRRRWIGAFLAAALLAVSAPSPVRADAMTFAQFTQASPGTPFVFANNSTSAQAGTISFTPPANFSFSVPVYFNFLTGPDTSTHLASFSFTAITNAPASSVPIAGSTFLDQPINGNGSASSDVLNIVDDATGKTLLSMSFTGDILGFQGDTTGQLSGSTSRGNTVNYTSQFGSFQSGPNSYSLGLTSINPALSIGPGGFLNSFSSSINGSFVGAFQTAAVPEPLSVAMLGTGIMATGFLATQRKRLAILRQS